MRRDQDAFRPRQSTHGGKSLASMGLDAGSLLSTPAAHDPRRVPRHFLSQYNINLARQEAIEESQVQDSQTGSEDPSKGGGVKKD
ncbi:hypothetical protein Tco_0485938 [Tanacetum coccineum]